MFTKAEEEMKPLCVVLLAVMLSAYEKNLKIDDSFINLLSICPDFEFVKMLLCK
ncbi:hypothetical protein STEG23_023091, partial [Scotinomys teguina]